MYRLTQLAILIAIVSTSVGKVAHASITAPPPATGHLTVLSQNFAQDTVKQINQIQADNQTKAKAAQEAAEQAERDKQAQLALEAEKPVIQAPVVSYEPSGCVTGYATGNYALDQLISHESGGRSCAENGSGCFGLLQACPGAPLRNACGGNPDCQIAWFQANKTGGRSWDTIWALWQTQGWW